MFQVCDDLSDLGQVRRHFYAVGDAPADMFPEEVIKRLKSSQLSTSNMENRATHLAQQVVNVAVML